MKSKNQFSLEFANIIGIQASKITFCMVSPVLLFAWMHLNLDTTVSDPFSSKSQYQNENVLNVQKTEEEDALDDKIERDADTIQRTAIVHLKGVTKYFSS